MNAQHWIKNLQLVPHPEGGYYKETYRCTEFIKTVEADRNISTAIYFLLEGSNRSHFHRIKSDELWFFHEGSTIEILLIENEILKSIFLGKDLTNGESLQAIIPAGCWFAAKIKDGKDFALVSCTVAPGFDFLDFELAKREKIKQEFPHYSDILDQMCLD